MMALTASLLVSLFFSSLGAAQTDNGKDCDCFRTNGSSASYFTRHIFQDFRNIGTGAIPSVIQNAEKTTTAPSTNKYFTSSAWTNNWVIEHWNNSDSMDKTSAKILMVNSPNNVFIESSPEDPKLSWLTLRTARLPDFQSTAEIDTQPNNMLYLSARFLARMGGSPGGCAGFFTYLPPGSNPTSVQEADIEILTGAPRSYAQFTNQPSFDDEGRELPQASVNTTLPGSNDWGAWNVWRMDWTPGMTTWYVNGVQTANISFQTPRDPAGLIMNMWSDGGLWTGSMNVGDQAFINIQWMEIAFNTSGKNSANGAKKRDEISSPRNIFPRRDDRLCGAVCSIDENITHVGTPALLWGASSAIKVSNLLLLPVFIILAATMGGL